MSHLAASYRIRAKQLRKLAELDVCKQTAQQLLAVARTYDKGAEIADAIERTYQALEQDKETECPASEMRPGLSIGDEMRLADNYKARAEEARTRAEEHASNLQALLKVAESYDELSVCAESIGRSRTPLN